MTTIIIPLYRGVLIEEVLHSIVAQEKVVISEIILVLNHALVSQKAHYLELTSVFRNATVTEIEENNVSIARNKGLSLSSSEFTLFLDEDCVLVDPNCLDKMHRKLDTNCGVGSLFILKGRPFKEQCYNFKINLWMQSHEKVLLAGGISLYRTEIIKRVGFDKQIDYGGSETSLQNQIFSKNLGSLDLVQEKMILHQVQEKWVDLFNKAKRQALRNKTFHSIPKLQYRKMIKSFAAESDLTFTTKFKIASVLVFEKFWNLF